MEEEYFFYQNENFQNINQINWIFQSFCFAE